MKLLSCGTGEAMPKKKTKKKLKETKADQVVPCKVEVYETEEAMAEASKAYEPIVSGGAWC